MASGPCFCLSLVLPRCALSRVSLVFCRQSFLRSPLTPSSARSHFPTPLHPILPRSIIHRRPFHTKQLSHWSRAASQGSLRWIFSRTLSQALVRTNSYTVSLGSAVAFDAQHSRALLSNVQNGLAKARILPRCALPLGCGRRVLTISSTWTLPGPSTLLIVSIACASSSES